MVPDPDFCLKAKYQFLFFVCPYVAGKQEQYVTCEVHFCTVHYRLLERREQLQLRFGFVIMREILILSFVPAPTHQPDKENKVWSV